MRKKKLENVHVPCHMRMGFLGMGNKRAPGPEMAAEDRMALAPEPAKKKSAMISPGSPIRKNSDEREFRAKFFFRENPRHANNF